MSSDIDVWLNVFSVLALAGAAFWFSLFGYME